MPGSRSTRFHVLVRLIIPQMGRVRLSLVVQAPNVAPEDAFAAVWHFLSFSGEVADSNPSLLLDQERQRALYIDTAALLLCCVRSSTFVGTRTCCCSDDDDVDSRVKFIEKASAPHRFGWVNVFSSPRCRCSFKLAPTWLWPTIVMSFVSKFRVSTICVPHYTP